MLVVLVEELGPGFARVAAEDAVKVRVELEVVLVEVVEELVSAEDLDDLDQLRRREELGGRSTGQRPRGEERGGGARGEGGAERGGAGETGGQSDDVWVFVRGITKRGRHGRGQGAARRRETQPRGEVAGSSAAVTTRRRWIGGRTWS